MSHTRPEGPRVGWITAYVYFPDVRLMYDAQSGRKSFNVPKL